MTDLLQRAQRLHTELQKDNYDAEGWRHVFDELKTRQLSDQTRALYDEVLAAFPTDVSRALPFARWYGPIGGGRERGDGAAPRP